jgi:hypothetical protein
MSLEWTGYFLGRFFLGLDNLANAIELVLISRVIIRYVTLGREQVWRNYQGLADAF